MTARLLGPDGKPIADCAVDFRLREGDKSLQFVTTGRDGRFRQLVPPGGRYDVRGFAGPYADATVAEGVTVEPGGRVDLGDVRVKP